MTSLSARLKHDTLDLHASTERAFEVFDLRTLAGYRAFLEAQAGAYLPLEHAADRGGAERWLPDWPKRRRGDLLRADLASLGVREGDLRLGGAPSLDPLGVAYVLEGSRHGGRILLKRVLAGGDAVAASATRFLRQSLDAGWWPRFIEALDDYGTAAGHIDAVLASASGAFDLFRERAVAVAAVRTAGARESGSWN